MQVHVSLQFIYTLWHLKCVIINQSVHWEQHSVNLLTLNEFQNGLSMFTFCWLYFSYKRNTFVLHNRLTVSFYTRRKDTNSVERVIQWKTFGRCFALEAKTIICFQTPNKNKNMMYVHITVILRRRISLNQVKLFWDKGKSSGSIDIQNGTAFL